MAYIFFLIGVGIAAIALAIWVTIYEHKQNKQFETE